MAESGPLRALLVTTHSEFVRTPLPHRAQARVMTMTLAREGPARTEALLDPLAARVPAPA